jgi:hypothetical protein
MTTNKTLKTVLEAIDSDLDLVGHKPPQSDPRIIDTAANAAVYLTQLLAHKVALAASGYSTSESEMGEEDYMAVIDEFVDKVKEKLSQGNAATRPAGVDMNLVSDELNKVLSQLSNE